MSKDDSAPVRRRKASSETLAAREAAALVRELNRQLGYWQAASVKLHTLAQRLKASGNADPAVADETRTLFRVVSAEAERFEGLLPAQSAAVAAHGRIQDTRRSFEMVADRLRSSLKLLGVEPERE
jgi:hypothetical protein